MLLSPLGAGEFIDEVGFEQRPEIPFWLYRQEWHPVAKEQNKIRSNCNIPFSSPYWFSPAAFKDRARDRELLLPPCSMRTHRLVAPVPLDQLLGWNWESKGMLETLPWLLNHCSQAHRHRCSPGTLNLGRGFPLILPQSLCGPFQGLSRLRACAH